MILVDVLSNESWQSMTVSLSSGDRVTLSFRYSDNQQGWFYNVSYKGRTLYVNRRLVTGVNLLRAFKEVITFGLACISSDGYEPVFQDDFANGRIQVFLLDPEDVIAAEAVIGAYA